LLPGWARGVAHPGENVGDDQDLGWRRYHHSPHGAAPLPGAQQQHHHQLTNGLAHPGGCRRRYQLTADMLVPPSRVACLLLSRCPCLHTRRSKMYNTRIPGREALLVPLVPSIPVCPPVCEHSSPVQHLPVASWLRPTFQPFKQ